MSWFKPKIVNLTDEKLEEMLTKIVENHLGDMIRDRYYDRNLTYSINNRVDDALKKITDKLIEENIDFVERFKNKINNISDRELKSALLKCLAERMIR